MLTTRVQYMDTSPNPQVKGAKYRTGRNPESNHCRERFQDPSFQTKLLELSPELRALKLFEEVIVTSFSLHELRECSASN
jgi:hypothetical protein